MVACGSDGSDDNGGNDGNDVPGSVSIAPETAVLGERTTFTFTFSSQEFKDSCTGSQFSGGHTLHGFISFTSDPVKLDITPKSLNPIKITLTCDGDQYPLEVEIQGS